MQVKALLTQPINATGGLHKNGQMPRRRIELGIRGFSVFQEHLLLEMLAYLAAVGQVAEPLMQELGSNNHCQAQVAELIQQSAQGGSHDVYTGRHLKIIQRRKEVKSRILRVRKGYNRTAREQRHGL